MENLEDFEITEDIRQSEEYDKFLRSINWQVVDVSKTKVFVKKLGPISISKVQRYRGNIDTAELEKVLKKYRVMRVTLEPLDSIPAGWKINSEPLIGTKTVRVDLRPSEKEIFDGFKKDCRYILRRMTNNQYSVTKNNFNKFYEIWKESGKRLGIWVPSRRRLKDLESCFEKKAFCLTINNQAGCVVIIHKKAAFYYYAGATKDGTRENLPYLVVWEAMKEAKKRGAVVWDFEGIFDARFPSKSWKGFSHFKKSFGGEEIEFPGSFSKWRWPF